MPTGGCFALQTQPQTRQGNTNGPQIQLVLTPKPKGPHQPISNFITFPCLQPNHRQLLATTSGRMICAVYCPKARDGVHWSTDTWSYAKIPNNQPCSILFSVGFIWLIFLDNPAQTDAEQLCRDQITPQLFPSHPNQGQAVAFLRVQTSSSNRGYLTRLLKIFLLSPFICFHFNP